MTPFAPALRRLAPALAGLRRRVAAARRAGRARAGRPRPAAGPGRGRPSWRHAARGPRGPGSRARLAEGEPRAEARALLCLDVSEAGWRATLHPADGAPASATAEDAAPGEAPLSTPDMLRRAVRAISPATRDGIGSIRLVVHDPAAVLVDSRVLRPRGVDAAAIRQAGAQELGSAGALHAFLPFGSSSEQETERGVYAFLPAGRISDYLGAMDSLAVKLVAVVPAWLPCLRAQGQPFAAIEIRAGGATLVLADPDSGAVAWRELAVGTRSFADAIARATSVSLREAAEGLERRFCLGPGSASFGAPSTTELALEPLLATLRTELLATMEYFVFQRLAGEPEHLLVCGEAARVRGLAEWLGGVLGLAPQAAPEPVPGAAGEADAQALNLLQDTPAGLLRIGRTDYRFVDGRFRSVQAQARQPRRPRTSLRSLAGQNLGLPLLRQGTLALADLPGPGAAVPALAAAVLGLGIWATLGAAGGDVLQANARLAQRLAGDAVLQHAALHPLGQAAAALPSPQPWSAKLSRVAALIPDGIWLTAWTTLPDPAAPARLRVVLEGAVPAAPGEDYIAGVAGFIDRLEADPVFMRDVASIAFEGASLAQGPAPNVAGFTISVALAPSFAAPRATSQAATRPAGAEPG